MKMHPHALPLGIHGGATGAECPASVEVTNFLTRSGPPRFDSAGERPALRRWVATDRSERARSCSRKRARSRPQQGVIASGTIRRLFGTTPFGSPRMGFSSTSATLQAENATCSFRISFSFSFAVLAGTKCEAARRISKRNYAQINARAGPASVETSGLSQKDSSRELESDDAGTNPLK